MQYPDILNDSDDLYCWINRHQNRYKYRDQGIDKNLLRTFKAYYYASISFVDYQIGHILNALEVTGQLDNTLIVFTSDHGELLGDYNCFGKRSMHDGSSRIPMIVKYPESFTPGKVCQQPVSLVDLFPTFTSAASADISKLDLDGENLTDIVNDKSSRKYVYSQFEEGQKGIYMILSKKWKYIYSAGDCREFLFDRVNDPKETTNKAGATLLEDVQTKLKNALLEYLKKENATEAYVEMVQGLAWKEYPKLDISYLKNPNAGLIIQDHGAILFDHDGYIPNEYVSL